MQNLLSDEELLEAWKKDARRLTGLEALRAVQSAVLAKAEVEAREMCREAAMWAAGIDDAGREGCFAGIRKSLGFRDAVDRKYPSIRPPKTVTLSTGEWEYVPERGSKWRRGNEHWLSPHCATAVDFETVAAYLRAEGK